MKKAVIKTFIFLCMSGFGLSVHAQYSELGLFIGGTNYKGELSHQLFNDKFISLGVGGFFRHNWTRHWGYRLQLNYGKIQADDQQGDHFWQLQRNLNFESKIVEFSYLLEFNFLPYEVGNREYAFTPFLNSGLTLFHFNPKAIRGDDKIELQPLGTEGQLIADDRTYRRLAVAFPIGGGIKFNIGQMGVSLEVAARRSYTDYLDDVHGAYADPVQLLVNNGPLTASLADRSIIPSDTGLVYPRLVNKMRGTPNDKDWYVFGGITLSFRLSSVMREICLPFKRRRY
jgi:hypothetical protein